MQNFLFSLAAISILFFSQTSSADPKEYLFQRMMMQNTPDPIVRPPLRAFSLNTSVGVYSQKIDHDDAEDTRTFTQRFWSNSTFAKGPDAPVLIFICGEG